MSYQDWDTIVLKKKGTPEKKHEITEPPKPKKGGGISHMTKVATSDDIVEHHEWTQSFRASILSFMQKNHMKQRDFAKAISVSESVVRDVLSGKSVYNHTLAQKILSYINKH